MRGRNNDAIAKSALKILTKEASVTRELAFRVTFPHRASSTSSAFQTLAFTCFQLLRLFSHVMDGTFDIPDSTDWLTTPLKDFSTLENALHCEICKEFYDTPMLTSCSHTFCSKCIRTALSTDGRCPSCRTADQASKLRNNLALQEVVARFLAARPAAIEVARREKEQAEKAKRPGKRKRAVLDSDDIAQAEEDKRTTRSKSRRLAASQTSEPEIVEVVESDDDGDGDFEPEEVQGDGLVECPLGCGKRMKIEAVDPHLDKCEDEKRQASRSKSRTPVNVFGNSRPSFAQNTNPPERINELNYSLLNETKLRAKLKELGIPEWGSKQLMIKRHTEWVNLWNANCDSKTPRSKRDLLRELDAWERTQGGRAPNVNGLASSIMRKDFDGPAWVNKNKDDFSRLIAEAKRKKHNPAMEPDRPKEVSEAENIPNVVPDPESENSDPLPLTTSQSSPPPSDPPPPARPYEDNPEAISSIREKVEAANVGQHIEPVMNAGFDVTMTDGVQMPASTSSNQNKELKPPPGVDNPALLAQNHFGLSRGNSMDEHLTNASTGLQCDLPTHLQSSPVRMPMFAVPRQPFNDVDGAVGGTAEH